jgi:hypothetical protein
MLTSTIPNDGSAGPTLRALAFGRVVRALIGAAAWLVVIVALCVAGIWLWRAGLPAVAWSVAITAVVVVPAALAGAAAARRDLRPAAPSQAPSPAASDALELLAVLTRRRDRVEQPSGLLSTRLPTGRSAFACTGRSGALLALWDEDGRLVHEDPAVATGPTAA